MIAGEARRYLRDVGDPTEFRLPRPVAPANRDGKHGVACDGAIGRFSRNVRFEEAASSEVVGDDRSKIEGRALRFMQLCPHRREALANNVEAMTVLGRNAQLPQIA
jgi:hypothetical protein